MEGRDRTAELHGDVESLGHRVAPVDAPESSATSRQKGYISLLKHSLEEIVSPFADCLGKTFVALTTGDIRVCDMIRRDLTTGEIARLQAISPATVKACFDPTLVGRILAETETYQLRTFEYDTPSSASANGRKIP